MKITVQSQTIGPEKKPPRRGKKTGAAPEKRPRRRTGSAEMETDVTNSKVASPGKGKGDMPTPAVTSPTGFSDLRPDDDIPSPGSSIPGTAVIQEVGKSTTVAEAVNLETSNSVSADTSAESVQSAESRTSEADQKEAPALSSMFGSTVSTVSSEATAKGGASGEECASETADRPKRRTMSLSKKSRKGQNSDSLEEEEAEYTEISGSSKHLTKEEKAAKKAAERVARENARAAKAEKKAAARAAKAAAKMAKKKGLPVEDEIEDVFRNEQKPTEVASMEAKPVEAMSVEEKSEESVEIEKKSEEIIATGENSVDNTQTEEKPVDNAQIEENLTENVQTKEKPFKKKKAKAKPIKEKRHMKEHLDDEDDASDFIDIIYDYNEGIASFTVLTFASVLILATISYFVTRIVI